LKSALKRCVAKAPETNSSDRDRDRKCKMKANTTTIRCHTLYTTFNKSVYLPNSEESPSSFVILTFFPIIPIVNTNRSKDGEDLPGDNSLAWLV